MTEIVTAAAPYATAFWTFLVSMSTVIMPLAGLAILATLFIAVFKFFISACKKVFGRPKQTAVAAA